MAVLLAGSASAQDVRLIADNARDALNAASLLRALDDDADPQDYVAAARADYRRLLTALYAEGRYGGTISITVNGVEAANIDPLDAPVTVDEVVIRVDAGPRFSFGDVVIAPLPPCTTLPADLGPRRTARTERVEAAVSGGLSAWRDLGYPKVEVADQRVVARHDDRKLDVNVTLDTGPRLRFGELNISGNDDVRTERIEEIAGLPKGEVYSPEEIAKAEQRLRRAGAFDSVALREADEANADGTIDINAQVRESRPRRNGLGIEVSTIDGWTLSAFWMHRNWLGGAERLRIDGEIAGIDGQTGGADYRLRGTFSRPATFNPDTDFFIRSELAREDEPEFLLDSASVEVGFSRRLTDDLTVSAALGLLTAREETDAGTREYTLLTLPLDATLERRDEPTDATEGYFLNASLTPFVSVVGDVNGARFFADTRGYYSFGEEAQVTLAARGQFGSVLSAGVDEAPADFLFYSGGGGTVRGQPYNDLGIDRIEDGEVITSGGTSFAGLQLEARFRVRRNISLVTFYDIGQVGDTALPFETGDWHAGAGFGLRYDTGIGPIRLDLATQASGDDVGEDLQVYVGIGQAF
ncbi:autotransporter assembly complex family protein [Cognatiyoonia sp. IB215182]|uniref:autotransporter assembly complex protein TamA n=1 Tax=Cognatiyoonia sp. IB215182 TaxID=3097353 RepID=UPI002A0FEA5B|nr:autotransporter assembly complex family protein [Cognatiyoonia sp. IB215182]MDX8354612.1 autotransporter assembly complex family protein [Cognatiyoonia sp. IB215182]